MQTYKKVIMYYVISLRILLQLQPMVDAQGEFFLIVGYHDEGFGGGLHVMVYNGLRELAVMVVESVEWLI